MSKILNAKMDMTTQKGIGQISSIFHFRRDLSKPLSDDFVRGDLRLNSSLVLDD